MLRSSIVAASALALCSAAAAQQTVQAKKVLGPVRDLGVYHMATGTFTRGAGKANISPDHIYRNDAPSGYFGTGWEGCWGVDEIMLPSTDPNGPFGPGPQDNYLVDGFDFSYCSQNTVVDFTITFYDAYVPCDDPASPAFCLNELPVMDLPGLPGGNACWILTVDLAGGSEICLAADGGGCLPGYDGGGNGFDHGGYGFAWDAPGTTLLTGPILNGDPTWKPLGDGTCYNSGFGNACGAMDATGLGQQDIFGISNDHNGFNNGTTGCPAGTASGCYFFGGYLNNNGCGGVENTPFAGFALNLYADCTVTCSPSDGTQTAYCDESQNPNNVADLVANTTDSQAPTLVLTMSNGPPGQFTYPLVGNGNNTVSMPPGAKGDLCVVGGSCLGRFDQDVGQIDSNGEFSVDLKASTNNPCNGNFFGGLVPGSTWNFQYWHRQPMGQPATFSHALEIVFDS